MALNFVSDVCPVWSQLVLQFCSLRGIWAWPESIQMTKMKDLFYGGSWSCFLAMQLSAQQAEFVDTGHLSILASLRFLENTWLFKSDHSACPPPSGLWWNWASSWAALSFEYALRPVPHWSSASVCLHNFFAISVVHLGSSTASRVFQFTEAHSIERKWLRRHSNLFKLL